MDNNSTQAAELAIQRYLDNANWWTVPDISFKLNKDGIHQSTTQLTELLRRFADRGSIQFRVSKNANTGQQYIEYALPNASNEQPAYAALR